MATGNCPGCGANPCELFYELASVPTNNRWLSPSRDQAVALPRGDIALKFCQGCGLVFNGVFDPNLIDGTGFHEERDEDSPVFEAFQRRLADQLIERYALVCSKNLLQSVPESTQCLELLRRILHKDARLFLQVSNFMRTLKNIAFWDINYPSCSYFTPGTLYRLLRAQSFAVSDVWTDFDAEYLMADARVAARGNTDSSPSENIETIADLADLVARFAHESRERQAMWCEILRKLAGGGNRIAIWGAGSRTASFLTTLAVGDEVSYVVDMNPGRQGKFTPGTGHRIVAPDVMVSMRPDVVIVMNSVVAFEIRDLLAQAGCAPTLLIA
jgi:hypothetical protein